MNVVEQAVILCGGGAKRLQNRVRGEDFLQGLPKPLVEVGGQAFVLYAMCTLRACGVRDIVLVVRSCDCEHYNRCLCSHDRWRTSYAYREVNEGILRIDGLRDTFILLNGDCLPIMGMCEWYDYAQHLDPQVTVRVIGDRDAGMATVRTCDVKSGNVDCGDIAGMRDTYRNYYVTGGLHIGTPQGLHRARQYVDICVFGQ